MAVKSNETSKVVLKVSTGYDPSGKETTAQRTVNRVNPGIDNDTALSLGTQVASLQSYTLSTVTRTDSAELE